MQQVDASDEALRVRERIVTAGGDETNYDVSARFDGAEYPVTGSPMVDTMAYMRSGPLRIDATGRKGSIEVFREIVTVSADAATLQLALSLRGADGRLIEGVAVFERVP